MLHPCNSATPIVTHDWFYDRSPQNQRFSWTNVSWLLDTRKGIIENKVSMLFLVCKRPIDRWRRGCHGTAYFRKYDRELVLKPSISLKESWGGYRRTALINPLNVHMNIYYQVIRTREQISEVSLSLHTIILVVPFSRPHDEGRRYVKDLRYLLAVFSFSSHTLRPLVL